MTHRNRPEHDHERGQVAPFYGGLGIDVYATSARNKAIGITPGVADLICFWERLGFPFFHETKMEGKRQSMEQHNFELRCHATATPYVLGGIEEAMDFVVYMGVAVRVGPTVRVKPREKWPNAADVQTLWESWKWAEIRHDAAQKYGFREAA